MARERHTLEQVLAKLREADALLTAARRSRPSSSTLVSASRPSTAGAPSSAA